MQKIRHVIYLILLIGLDQITKYWVVNNLKGANPLQIIPGVLQLTYHENNGAVWGIMSGKIILLILVTIIILSCMLVFYFKIPGGKRYDLIRIIMVFITAGALGNFIDRSFRHFVVDFIYFELIDFPVFNVADMYITCSAFILIILSLFYYKDDDFAFLNKKEEKTNE